MFPYFCRYSSKIKKENKIDLAMVVKWAAAVSAVTRLRGFHEVCSDKTHLTIYDSMYIDYCLVLDIYIGLKV